MYAYISPNLALLDDFLVEHRRGALWKHVALELGALLVGLDIVSLERRFVLGDDGNVDIGTRTQIIEDTSQDGLTAQLDGVILRQVGSPLRLKDAHGSQAAASHGDIRQLVGAAMCVDGEQVRARGVAPRNDEIRSNVALVAEKMLLEEGHASDDAGLAAGGKGVQLQLRGNEGSRELGVGSGAGASTPYLGSNVVQLLAVLVGDDGT